MNYGEEKHEPKWMDDALNDPNQTSIFDTAQEVVEEDFAQVPDLDSLRELSREPISRCGHCGGRSKVYAYKLGSYVRVLCWLAYMEKQEKGSSFNYYHVPSSGAINGGGDYAKLRFWGLIEAMPKSDSHLAPRPWTANKRSSGMWRLTHLGREFVFGRTTVSSTCYYRHPEGGVLGFEPEQVGIRVALGENFNYHSLMNGYTQTKTRGPK